MLNNRQALLACELHRKLEEILVDYCECIGRVSLRCCEDIILHHERDLLRLRAIQADGIHPTKHIGYLAFWVRKLKPISCAFPTSLIITTDDRHQIDEKEEIALINELAAVYLSQHLLMSYADDGVIFQAENEKQKKTFMSALLKSMRFSILDDHALGPSTISLLTNIIYDMRYRTFGPHHLVHILNHLIYAAEVHVSRHSE